MNGDEPQLSDDQWWDLLLDGEPHLVREDINGYKSLASFRGACYHHANLRGVQVQVSSPAMHYPWSLIRARLEPNGPTLRDVGELAEVHQMPPKQTVDQRRWATVRARHEEYRQRQAKKLAPRRPLNLGPSPW